MQEVNRYMKRISGPLLNRIDICVEMGKIDWEDIGIGKMRKKPGLDARQGETSSQIRKRVMAAKEVQFNRQNKFNANLTNDEVRKVCIMDTASEKLLKYTFKKRGLSIRSCQRIRKVARTIADMDGSDRIHENHISEAIILNSGLEKEWGKTSERM